MSDVLSRFREAGRNGLQWHEAINAIAPSLDDEDDLFSEACKAHDAGELDRVRAAVEQAAESLREGHDADLDAYQADFLIDVAAQAAPIEPEDLVAIVKEFCPVPPNALRLAEQALTDFQYIPNRRAEPAYADAEAAALRQFMAPQIARAECLAEIAEIKREALTLIAAPDADRRLTAAEARADCQAAIERSRAVAGMPPLPVLRWVDYTRGATYSPPSWLVKNVLPGRGLGLIYGESSAGKTFLAVHASLCIAWGVPFFGRRAKPGGVLYIAAEGGSGVLPRFDAAEHVLEGAIAAAHLTGSRDPAVARAPIRIVTEAPNLSREGDTAPLIRTIRATAADFERLGFPLAVVIVDTLHAALGGGDENSAADMGHALKPLKDAVEEMNLFALIVHHPGKALERGARGSGSLPAAVDTSIELHVPGCTGPGAKPAGMMRCATVVKQRDGAVGESLHYRLPVTTIGVDEDGEPWTTCTVQPCDPPKLGDDGLSKTDRNLIDAVRATLAEEGGERARFEVARLRFFNLLGEKTAAAKRQAWGRALKIARDAGRIETDDHDLQIWISKPAGEV